MEQYSIRKYRSTDRSQVERIHYETAFIGKSLEGVYNNRKDWAREASYYLDKEPESCFVLEDIIKKEVVGYVFGCLDDRKNNELKHTLSSFFRHLAMMPFAKEPNRKFLKGRVGFLVGALSGKTEEMKLKTPKEAGHLHINLLPEARADGWGTRLYNEFEKYAREKGVKTLHAGSFYTSLNPNENFWKQNGFHVYSEVNTGFWRKHYPEEDIRLRTYVKEL